jgi:hypothetical protein
MNSLTGLELLTDGELFNIKDRLEQELAFLVEHGCDYNDKKEQLGCIDDELDRRDEELQKNG